MLDLIPVDSIDIVASDQLSSADWQEWCYLQRTYGCYEGPSMRPEFTRELARIRPNLRIARFRHGTTRVGYCPYVYDSAGHAYPAGQWLMSFQGPVIDPRFTIPIRPWLAAMGVRQFQFDRFVAPHSGFATSVLMTAASPVVDLSAGYAAYRVDLQGRGSHLIKRVEQKQRRAQRLLGQVTLQDESHDPHALSELIAWRRRRNQEILAIDFLSLPWVRRFVQALLELSDPQFRGRLLVLRFDNRPVAALLGMQSSGVFECMMTAFAPAAGHYSPGLLLFHNLCREASRFGLHRIHLTRGTEHFKERFENDSRPVSDVLFGNSRISYQWLRGVLALQECIRQTPLGQPAQRMLRRIRLIHNPLSNASLHRDIEAEDLRNHAVPLADSRANASTTFVREM